jgi:hypothetical protein
MLKNSRQFVPYVVYVGVVLQQSPLLWGHKMEFRTYRIINLL